MSRMGNASKSLGKMLRIMDSILSPSIYFFFLAEGMCADYVLACCSDDEIEEIDEDSESQNRKRPYYPASPVLDYSQFTFGELVDEIRSLKRANVELKEENQMLRDRNIQVYRYKKTMLERVAKFEAFVEWAKEN